MQRITVRLQLGYMNSLSFGQIWSLSNYLEDYVDDAIRILGEDQTSLRGTRNSNWKTANNLINKKCEENYPIRDFMNVLARVASNRYTEAVQCLTRTY